AIGGDRRGGDRGSQSLGQLGGVRADLDDEGELLSAVAADEIAFADRTQEPAADLLDHLVADQMPVHVVDLLEVVDVDHDRGQWAVARAGCREAEAGKLEETPPVVRPGQRVGPRQVPNLVEQAGVLVGNRALTGKYGDDFDMG